MHLDKLRFHSLLYFGLSRISRGIVRGSRQEYEHPSGFLRLAGYLDIENLAREGRGTEEEESIKRSRAGELLKRMEQCQAYNGTRRLFTLAFIKWILLAVTTTTVASIHYNTPSLTVLYTSFAKSDTIQRHHHFPSQDRRSSRNSYSDF